MPIGRRYKPSALVADLNGDGIYDPWTETVALDVNGDGKIDYIRGGINGSAYYTPGRVANRFYAA